MLSIEVTAARYAAQRGDQDLKKMKQALVGMEYALVNDKLGDEEDYQFHLAIVQATHNPHLVALNDYLEANVRRVIRSAQQHRAHVHRAHGGGAERASGDLRGHRGGDPDAAGRAAEQHLRNAADRLRLFQAERPAPV